MKTKHFLTVAIFLIGVPSLLLATTAAFENSTNTSGSSIPSGPSLPSECDPASSKLFLRTTGPGAGLYECTSRNNWTPVSAPDTARPGSAGTSKIENYGDLQPVLIARALPTPKPEPTAARGNPAPAAPTSAAGTGTCPASQFVTAVNAGAPTCKQPAFSNLSGSATASQLPAATATSQGALQLSGDLAGTGGTPKVAGLQGQPVSTASPPANQVLTWNGTAWAPATPSGGAGTGACPSNQFVTAVNSGAPTCGQAVYAAPAPAHQYATGMSAAGSMTYAQPSFADLSGTAAASQLPQATTSALGAVRPGRLNRWPKWRRPQSRPSHGGTGRGIR